MLVTWIVTKRAYLDGVLGKGVLAHLILTLISKEIHDFSAVIALKLDHFTHIRVLNDGSIAS